MCEYTEDYTDEPHGIVCAEIEGENVLIDVDEYMEGYDPHELRLPCPNCDMTAHIDYLLDTDVMLADDVSEYKKNMELKIKTRLVEIQDIRNPKCQANQNTQ